MKKKISILLSLAIIFAMCINMYAASTTSYSSTTANSNAIKVSGETKTISNAKITKTGDASQSDNNDFYGTNAAVLAADGANLTITNSDVTTTASYGNGVFSYGSGTTVNISNSTITTNSRNSGGIMVTGGGTLNATELFITTKGGSSAPIRSDRGGGTLYVKGGTYKSAGSGSPAVYSTADITVENATLYAGVSEAVVVEGKNSVTLTNSNVTSSHTVQNSNNTTNNEAVMIYQSMSGDASQGEGTFTMTGGSLTAKKGDVFFVTNTDATIKLNNVSITNSSDNSFLKVAAAGWGNSGSNGGNLNVDATAQAIQGAITVDSVSALNLSLDSSSTFNGYISNSGKTYVEIASGGKWTLTSDSSITSLSCDENAITLNGHTLKVNGTAYTAGTKVEGEKITFSTRTNSQQNQNGQPPEMNGQQNGQQSGQPNGQPPEMNGQQSGQQNGQPNGNPPPKPSWDTTGDNPPPKPNGEEPPTV